MPPPVAESGHEHPTQTYPMRGPPWLEPDGDVILPQVLHRYQPPSSHLSLHHQGIKSDHSQHSHPSQSVFREQQQRLPQQYTHSIDNERQQKMRSLNGERFSSVNRAAFPPVSQLSSENRGPPVQSSASFTIRPPQFISHDGLPRAPATQSRILPPQPASKMAVVIKTSPSRLPNTKVPVPQSFVQGYNRGTPSKDVSMMGLRVEIPTLKSAPPGFVAHKKRGRPFRTPEAAAAAAAKKARKQAGEHRSHEKPIKKRGRPFKKPPAHVEIPGPEPRFNIYFCEWTNCPAELHNVKTLRQHLHVVHCKRNPKNKMLPCLWRNCHTGTEEVLDEKTNTINKVNKTTEFRNREDWKKHVEQVHLLPVLWYEGDGPKGTDLGMSILSLHFPI